MRPLVILARQRLKVAVCQPITLKSAAVAPIVTLYALSQLTSAPIFGRINRSKINQFPRRKIIDMISSMNRVIVLFSHNFETNFLEMLDGRIDIHIFVRACKFVRLINIVALIALTLANYFRNTRVLCGFYCEITFLLVKSGFQ